MRRNPISDWNYPVLPYIFLYGGNFTKDWNDRYTRNVTVLNNYTHAVEFV